VAAVVFVVIAIITQSAIAMSQGSLANCGQPIPETPMSVPMAAAENGVAAPLAFVLRALDVADPEPTPTPTNSTPADPPEPPTWPGCVVAFNWSMGIFEAIRASPSRGRRARPAASLANPSLLLSFFLVKPPRQPSSGSPTRARWPSSLPTASSHRPPSAASAK